jgi:ribonuclease J
VAVTAFASNVARLDTVVKAAKVHGRRPVLVGRAMHKIVAAARETGYLKDFPQTLDEQEAEDHRADKLLYLVTGSQGEPRAALARIASGTHPYVSLGEGDAVIYSSRVIPGNEISIFETQNKLAALGVEVLTDADHFVHVSGHPCREELSEMYRWTRPRISVPVHGERRHQEAHAALARSLQVPEAPVIGNGQMLRLAPGKAEIIDETPAGRIYMDGRIMTDSSDDALRRRKAMAFAGLIVATVALDEKGRVVGEPALLLEGVPESAHEKLYQTLDSEISRYRPRKGDDEGLKEVLRRALRRTAQDIWGKKPITRVEIIWV